MTLGEAISLLAGIGVTGRNPDNIVDCPTHNAELVIDIDETATSSDLVVDLRYDDKGIVTRVIIFCP